MSISDGQEALDRAIDGDVVDGVPFAESPEPFEREDAAEAPALDSEIDFDDEQPDEQAPLDLLEAEESASLFDDPEVLSGTGDPDDTDFDSSPGDRT